jgi:drug/metabolite transporter (DMT)-like permease
MTLGVLYALGAGLLWGLVFITPVLLPTYSGMMLSVGRYIAFGLIALAIAWPSRAKLKALEKEDWVAAAWLSLVGNIIYYSTLAAAIQLADPPLPTMIIGALPIVIAICANLSESTLPWRRLALPLLVIALGIGCVNHEELGRLQASGAFNLQRHALGAFLAIVALGCWTWYPIRNSRWLKRKSHLDSSTWATVQGLTTLPLALLGYAILLTFTSGPALGTDPVRFLGLMLVLGFFASWLGTLMWNRASQLLPSALSGQLIVFETLAALIYTYVWRRDFPGFLSCLGIALLIIGVILGVRVFSTNSAAALDKSQ